MEEVNIKWWGNKENEIAAKVKEIEYDNNDNVIIVYE